MARNVNDRYDPLDLLVQELVRKVTYLPHAVERAIQRAKIWERTYWDELDVDELLEWVPGQCWIYDTAISTAPIYYSLMPGTGHELFIVQDVDMYPTVNNNTALLEIVKRSIVGHDHPVLRIGAYPSTFTYGGLDRSGKNVQMPVIVPLRGCFSDPRFDDGVHINATNCRATIRFRIFSLLINIARRDSVVPGLDFDFLDPQGNIYSYAPANDIWTDYAEWSGSQTSEQTVWCCRITPPVRAYLLGVVFSARQPTQASGSYVKVQVSVDGQTWQDVYSLSPIPTSETTVKVRSQYVKARYVRVVCNPAGQNAIIRVYNVLIWC